MVSFVNFLSLAIAATLSYGLCKAAMKQISRKARIHSQRVSQASTDRDYF